MKFLKKLADSFVHARRLQAAYRCAEYLKATNKDFRDISLGDIVNRMMDEKNPTTINGTPVK